MKLLEAQAYKQLGHWNKARESIMNSHREHPISEDQMTRFRAEQELIQEHFEVAEIAANCVLHRKKAFAKNNVDH